MERTVADGEVALNLGCGDIVWPGWIGVDGFSDKAQVKADLLNMPFPEAYADRIAMIHVIEHFYLWDAKKVLRDCYRILKPGGELILELPCMDSIFAYIAHTISKGEQPASWFSWYPIWGDPKPERPEMMHKWGFFRRDIAAILADAGFVNVTFEEPNYHFPQRDMRVVSSKS